MTEGIARRPGEVELRRETGLSLVQCGKSVA